MVLYKLSFALLPIHEIYAYEKTDILDWLRWFEQHPRKVLTLPGKEQGGIEDIIEIEKGELRFDFGGMVAGSEYAYVDLTPDFVAKIRLESVPSFHFFRERLSEQKVGNVYKVKVSNGSFASTSYVPYEVIQGLKNCDLAAAEKKAEEHIEKLNKALSESRYFAVEPKPTKKSDFN